MESSSSGVFFEELGNLLFRPSKYLNLKKDSLLRDSIQKEVDLASNPPKIMVSWYHHLFIQFFGVFMGFSLMFYFLYPEIYWYPDVIIEQLKLLLMYTANPLYFLGIFLFGYLLIVINYYLTGWVAIKIFKYSQLHPKSNIHSVYKRVLGLYSFSFAPLGFLLLYLFVQIDFFEKFNYAKFYFPFADLSELNIITIIVFLLCFLWRWNIERAIFQSIFDIGLKKAILPIILRGILLVGIFSIVLFIINLRVSEFG